MSINCHEPNDCSDWEIYDAEQLPCPSCLELNDLDCGEWNGVQFSGVYAGEPRTIVSDDNDSDTHPAVVTYGGADGAIAYEAAHLADKTTSFP